MQDRQGQATSREFNGQGKADRAVGFHPAPSRLKPEHAGLIAELERECFPTPWSAAQLRQGMDTGGVKVYGLVEKGRLLGYLSCYSVESEAEIINFAVRPDRRRQGLGRAILHHVLQKWREEGIHNGFLEVRASNDEAIGLYGSCGFRQVGVRKNYYPETGEDALLMKLSLPVEPVEPDRPAEPAEPVESAGHSVSANSKE